MLEAFEQLSEVDQIALVFTFGAGIDTNLAAFRPMAKAAHDAGLRVAYLKSLRVIRT